MDAVVVAEEVAVDVAEVSSGRCARRKSHLSRLWAACAGSTALLLCIGAAAESGSRRSFDTPETAAEALLEAMQSEDVAPILGILGREHQAKLLNPDAAAGRAGRKKLLEHARVYHSVREGEDGEMELVIGEAEWPFPIPLVREGNAWVFDTDAGVEELVDRRIGANELNAIEVSHLYVDAQMQYAGADRDGDQVLEYAQLVRSTPSRRDGLFWKDDPDADELSPFGPLVAV